MQELSGAYLVDSIHNLGETVPWRQALFDTSWRRWEFWLFTAVASWALVPVLEELFYRGYCQRRLAEDWGDGPAIVGTACLFIFGHSQYLMPNAYNLSLLASLFILAVGLGLVYAWTRSIVPSVIAHAIINVPMTPLWQGVVLTTLLIGAVVAARWGAIVVKKVFSRATVFGCAALAVVGTGYAIVSSRVKYLDLAAVGMVVLAVGLEAMDRRRERPAKPVLPPG